MTVSRQVRRRLMRVYDHLYDLSGSLTDPCKYCGLPATTWDHIPPLHAIDRISEEDRYLMKLRKIPSCTECNSVLGGILLNTVDERRGYIKKYLRKKYASLLRMPAWDEEELGELSRQAFRDDVKNHSKVSALIKQRLGWR